MNTKVVIEQDGTLEGSDVINALLNIGASNPYQFDGELPNNESRYYYWIDDDNSISRGPYADFLDLLNSGYSTIVPKSKDSNKLEYATTFSPGSVTGLVKVVCNDNYEVTDLSGKVIKTLIVRKKRWTPKLGEIYCFVNFTPFSEEMFHIEKREFKGLDSETINITRGNAFRTEGEVKMLINLLSNSWNKIIDEFYEHNKID